MNKMEEEIYNAITEFSNKYGYHRFNDDKNHKEYMNLVDMCINAGMIPKENRNEFSTHGRLETAIIYIDNRIRFCEDAKKEV